MPMDNILPDLSVKLSNTYLDGHDIHAVQPEDIQLSAWIRGEASLSSAY